MVQTVPAASLSKTRCVPIHKQIPSELITLVYIVSLLCGIIVACVGAMGRGGG